MRPNFSNVFEEPIRLLCKRFYEHLALI